MGSLIENFHIDVTTLIAQMINFGIVFAVLYYFAIKPLMKVMAERTTKIEKSLNDAIAIDNRLKETEEEYKKEIAQAKKEANEILEKSQIHAEEKRKQMLLRAKEEIGEIINEEKAKMQSEKAAVLKEIKSEVAGLVALSLEKLLEKKVDIKEDKELIQKIIK